MKIFSLNSRCTTTNPNTKKCEFIKNCQNPSLRWWISKRIRDRDLVILKIGFYLHKNENHLPGAGDCCWEVEPMRNVDGFHRCFTLSNLQDLRDVIFERFRPLGKTWKFDDFLLSIQKVTTKRILFCIGPRSEGYDLMKSSVQCHAEWKYEN